MAVLTKALVLRCCSDTIEQDNTPQLLHEGLIAIWLMITYDSEASTLEVAPPLLQRTDHSKHLDIRHRVIQLWPRKFAREERHRVAVLHQNCTDRMRRLAGIAHQGEVIRLIREDQHRGGRQVRFDRLEGP